MTGRLPSVRTYIQREHGGETIELELIRRLEGRKNPAELYLECTRAPTLETATAQAQAFGVSGLLLRL